MKKVIEIISVGADLRFLLQGLTTRQFDEQVILAKSKVHHPDNFEYCLEIDSRNFARFAVSHGIPGAWNELLKLNFSLPPYEVGESTIERGLVSVGNYLRSTAWLSGHDSNQAFAESASKAMVEIAQEIEELATQVGRALIPMVWTLEAKDERDDGRMRNTGLLIVRLTPVIRPDLNTQQVLATNPIVGIPNRTDLNEEQYAALLGYYACLRESDTVITEIGTMVVRRWLARFGIQFGIRESNRAVWDCGRTECWDKLVSRYSPDNSVVSYKTHERLERFPEEAEDLADAWSTGSPEFVYMFDRFLMKHLNK